jgi:hypothetical protein
MSIRLRVIIKTRGRIRRSGHSLGFLASPLNPSNIIIILFLIHYRSNVKYNVS